MTWQSLGTYPREMKTCIQVKNLSVFITALLMISRLEKARSLSVSEWINRLWCIQIQQWKGVGYWDMHQLGWILKLFVLNGKSPISKDYILWYSTYRTFLKYKQTPKKHKTYSDGEWLTSWEGLGVWRNSMRWQNSSAFWLGQWWWHKSMHRSRFIKQHAEKSTYYTLL